MFSEVCGTKTNPESEHTEAEFSQEVEMSQLFLMKTLKSFHVEESLLTGVSMGLGLNLVLFLSASSELLSLRQ